MQTHPKSEEKLPEALWGGGGYRRSDFRVSRSICCCVERLGGPRGEGWRSRGLGEDPVLGIDVTRIDRFNERVEEKRNWGQVCASGLQLSMNPRGGPGLQEKTEFCFSCHPERDVLGHPSGASGRRLAASLSVKRDRNEG